MWLVNKLKEFFYIGRISEQKFAAEADRLIEYTASLVLHNDMIKSQLTRIEAAKVLPQAEKAKEYIKVYFELEKFIIEHEPLVVKRKFTQEELRKDIRGKLGTLGGGLDLLLSGDIEQAVKLCKIMYESILNQTTAMLGQATSKRFIDKVGVFEFRAAEFRNPEQVISSFQKILSNLHSSISDAIGKEKAKSLFEVNYKKLQEVYGFIPYTIEILKALPLGILEEEKIKVISRFELEEKVKERTKELLSAKEYTDNIIKSMIDTLIVVDPDAKIKTINKATSLLLGYTEEELIGKPVGMILAEEEEEEEEAPFKGTKLKKLIETGFIKDYEMIYKMKTGEKIPVSFSGSVMRDKDGNLIGVVGIARDMRDIKNLMDELKKTLDSELAKTADLKRTQDVSLNVMEDLENSRKELEKAYMDLKKKTDLLERFQKVAIGRELEMVKLKEEVNKLLEKLDQPKKYEILGRIER